LNLAKIFPGLKIVQRKVNQANKSMPVSSANKSRNATPEELEEFMGLEKVFDEYDARMKSLRDGNGGGVSITAQVAGGLLGFINPAAGRIVTIGGSVLGHYLSKKKTNEVKSDLSYDKVFLVAYSCPRCHESFQKKPWVTIRDCNKCKVVFRS